MRPLEPDSGYVCVEFPRTLVTVSHVIKDKSSGVENELRLAHGKQHLRAVCPKSKLEFKFIFSSALVNSKAAYSTA